MQQVPPKVAEIREAVAATAGQLQQLRVDVQSSVANLKADSEDHLSHAMQEINGSLDVFLEAGFELGGMDLEISPVQRLLVHLYRLQEVHPSKLRAIIATLQNRKTTQAILTAMLQAQEMADTVQLSELTKFDYRELIVSIGPIPSVRICWSPEQAAEAQAVAPPDKTIPVPPPIASPIPATQSVFGQGSFFEKRTLQPAPVAAPATAVTPVIKISPVVSTPAEESHVTKAAHASPAEEHDPLARFKKMPDLFKQKK
jgi:hypothetical protein